MSLTLFNVLEEYRDLIHEVQEAEGEVTPEMEQALAINQDNMVRKVSGYTKIMKFFDSQIEAAKDEKAKLDAFIKEKEANINRMKAMLLQAVLLYGTEDKKKIKRLEIGTIRLSTRKSEETVVTNALALPDTLKTYSLKKISHEDFLNICEQFPHLVENSQMDEISKTKAKEEITKVPEAITETDTEIYAEDVPGVKILKKFNVTIK